MHLLLLLLLTHDIENDLKGNGNWFELSRVRVTKGKITVNV